MAEVIQLREFQEARRRADRRSGDHHNLERAVQIMRANLAAAAVELRDAGPAEQPELLDRVERLTAMVRYGLGMMGDASAKPAR